MGTGPGWLDGDGKPIHCEIDIGMAACNTRSTQQWLGPDDYAGTPQIEDDVVGGFVQPWNLLGARYCPPTTTTTTPDINDTTTWWEFELRSPEGDCEVNCSNATNSTIWGHPTTT